MDDDICVGSMGLHQNNLLENDGTPKNFSSHSASLWQLNNRSVVDVFRGIRDKYFGKPEIPKPSERKQSVQHISDSENVDDAVESLETIPVYCQLMILSFLDTKDICNVALVNSQWHGIANDQILWRELLIRDMCEWDSMTNKSHPLLSMVWNNENVSRLGYGISIADLMDDCVPNSVVHECSSTNALETRRSKGVNYKALYIHSSFRRVQDDTEELEVNSGFPSILKSLWQGNDTNDQGEVIITGPGIDSPRTSKIFRSLMWGNEFLETKGLLPGNRDGIGSGVQVVFKGKISFNLIALYSGNNRVRERRVGMERLMNSNIMDVIQSRNDDDNDGGNHGESTTQFSLHESVRYYIAERKHNYKLIFAVDASDNQKWEDIACNRMELDTLLKGTEVDSMINTAIIDNESRSENGENPPATHTKRPLLVLSCVKDNDTKRLPSIQITAMLGLPDITDRQWRVQDVNVSDLKGVERGLEWLLRQP